MNIVQLEYFTMVAQEGNLTRAAYKLNLSQPALSASISKLEEELDTKLFNRVGRQIILNEDGRIFLDYAKKILCNYHTLLSELDKNHRQSKNIIRISFNTYEAQNNIISGFSSRYPEIYIYQKMETVEADGSIIFPERSDFYISNNVCSGKNLDSVVLGTDDILAVMTRTHPLACRSNLSFSDLIDEKIVTNHEGSGYTLLIDNLFESYGYAISYKAYAIPSNWKHYIEKNYIAISTGSYVREGGFPSSFVFLPILDENGNHIQRQLRLYWRTDVTMIQSARLFLDYVKQSLV